MIALPETEQVKRSRELAIIHAFFLPGSAAAIAQAFSTDARKLHAADVLRIWREAKQRGDLPKIDRPRAYAASRADDAMRKPN